MSRLTNPVTGHQINVDEQSVEFWQAAGYRSADEPKQEKKAPAKRIASSKSSK